MKAYFMLNYFFILLTSDLKIFRITEETENRITPASVGDKLLQLALINLLSNMY